MARQAIRRANADRKPLLHGDGRARAIACPSSVSVLSGAAPLRVPNAVAPRLSLRSFGPALEGVVPVSPMLTYYHYITGGTNFAAWDSTWTVPGYLTYRLRNMGSGAIHVGATSPLGVDYYRLITSGLTAYATYQLDWRLNCNPDVVGWDDAAWRYTGFQFVQPGRFDAPLDGDGPIQPV